MSDRILFSIGEALIDMIPSRVGCTFDEVPSFSPRTGGAPANVCAAFARLGGASSFLTQLGDDPFGHKIARELEACGIDLSHLVFTGKANTALAFVSLEEDGNRTFSFYRKPSADLLYSPEQIDPAWFADAFALHYCSVSLVDSPMRYAHLAAISAAREAGAIVSFDPNLREPLWPSLEPAAGEELPQPPAVLLPSSGTAAEYVPNAAEVEALAKLIYGEAGIVPSTTEQAAVVWCVLNRVDDPRFPDTVLEVIEAPYQFSGYDPEYPVKEEFALLAADVLTRYRAERDGEENVGRVLPAEYCFFTGDGRRNHFTTEWKSTDCFGWTLESPYTD